MKKHKKELYWVGASALFAVLFFLFWIQNGFLTALWLSGLESGLIMFFLLNAAFEYRKYCMREIIRLRTKSGELNSQTLEVLDELL